MEEIEEASNREVMLLTEPLTRVYSAEEYHQRFFEKNPGMAW